MEHRKKIAPSLWFFLFAVVLLAFGSLFYYFYASEQVGGKDKGVLSTAFEAADADFQEIKVQSWAKIDNKNYSLEEIEGVFAKIEGLLPLEAGYTIEPHEAQYYTGMTVTGKTTQGYDITMTVQSISDDYSADETYLIVNLSESLDYAEADAMTKLSDKYFTLVDAKGDTSTLISGVYERILSKEEKESLGKKVFRSVGAKVLETMNSNTYLSMSGYCKGIKNVVVSDEKEINLQVALFDNEVKGETCIYIGSPLIFSEY